MNCRFLSMISPLGMQRRDCCSSRRGHNSSGKNEHKKKQKTAYGVGLPSFHAGLPVSTWDSCLISSSTSCFTSSFTSTLGVCRSVHKVAVKTGFWCPHIPTKDSFGNSHPEKAWIQYMICIMNIFKTTSCKTTGELMFAGWCPPIAVSAAVCPFGRLFGIRPTPKWPSEKEHFGFLHTSGKVCHFRRNHNVQKMPKALQASNSYIESLLFFHFLLDFLSLLLRKVPWLATAQGSHAQRFTTG